MAEVLGQVNGLLLADIKDIRVRVKELSDELIGHIGHILSVSNLTELTAFSAEFLAVYNINALAEEGNKFKEFNKVVKVAELRHFEHIIRKDFVAFRVLGVQAAGPPGFKFQDFGEERVHLDAFIGRHLLRSVPIAIYVRVKLIEYHFNAVPHVVGHPFSFFVGEVGDVKWVEFQFFRVGLNMDKKLGAKFRIFFIFF